jgi:opacity protein-like surface antigen
MRKALLAVLFLAFSAPLALAQSEYKRGEFGVGYSAAAVDTEGAFNTNANSDDRDWFHGFYVNGGYNFTRYVGVQAEVSHHRKTTDFTNLIFQPVRLEGRLTQGLVGVKLQDNATDTKVRPFARALVGFGKASADETVTISPTSTNSFSDDDTGFAAVLGGGVAFRVSRHADIVTSADYNPIRLGDNSTVLSNTNEFTHNFRLGVGVNFRF